MRAVKQFGETPCAAACSGICVTEASQLDEAIARGRTRTRKLVEIVADYELI